MSTYYSKPAETDKNNSTAPGPSSDHPVSPSPSHNRSKTFLKNSSDLYRITLITAAIVLTVSTFFTIFLILFSGFSSSTGRATFITWQTFWFGLLSILFAHFYEKSSADKISKGLSLACVASSFSLLLIGIVQAIGLDSEDLLNHFKDTLSIFLYWSILAEMLLTMKNLQPTIKTARNIIIGILYFTVFLTSLLVIFPSNDFLDDAPSRIVTALSTLTIASSIILGIVSKATATRPDPATHKTPPQQSTASPLPLEKSALAIELSKRTNLDQKTCTIACNLFENRLLANDFSKDTIVADLSHFLSIDDETALAIYDAYADISISTKH